LTIGAFYLADFTRLADPVIRHALAKTEVSRVSSSILSGIRKLAAAAGPADCTISLADFRDFSKTSVDPVVLNYSTPSGQKTMSPAPPKCLVNSTADADLQRVIDEDIDSLEIRVQSLESPDLKNLTMRIKADVVVRGRQDRFGGSSAAIHTVSKRMILRVANLSFFNVVFTGEASPLIVPGAATVDFRGQTLLAAETKTFNLSSEMNPVTADGDPVTFSGTFFTRTRGLGLDLQAGDSVLGSKISSKYKGGIEQSIFSEAGGVTLPIPPLPSVVGAWSQKFDYSNSGLPLPDGSFMNPAAVSFIPGTAASSEINYNAAAANFNQIPSALSGITTLLSTCESSGGAALLPTPLVIQRYDLAEFEIDFTVNNESHFCGLVAAKKLKIKTVAGAAAANRVYQLIGNFIVDQIEVTGSGRVIFYNPLENKPLDLAFSSAGYSLANVAADMNRLVSGHGGNFFVPIVRDTLNAPNTLFWPQRAEPGKVRYVEFSGPNRIVVKSSVDKLDYLPLWTGNLNPAFFVMDTM
ncbi:MAG: hypothetical protein KGQ59_09805, partial [Bdellovibrionales bacterium]|nr:hypothetical protein [Bdellovibrionales bacterium]